MCYMYMCTKMWTVSGGITGDFDSLVFPKICTENALLKVLVSLENDLANSRTKTYYKETFLNMLCLSVCGKSMRFSSSWVWHKIQSTLSSKCEHGIVKEMQFGVTRTRMSTPASPPLSPQSRRLVSVRQPQSSLQGVGNAGLRVSGQHGTYLEDYLPGKWENRAVR